MRPMNHAVLAAVLALTGATASAKLPPPDEATKAKAAETAAKAAWQAKVDTYQLCKVQDRIAAAYAKSGGKGVQAAQITPVSAAPAAMAGASAASAAAPGKPAAASGTPAAVSPASAPASAPAMVAAASSGTPAAAALPTPCAEPGPFTYTPPEQKPLEASGAHSPAGTAVSPPSVKPNSAEMAPAKK
jgi:hypothetical protein